MSKKRVLVPLAEGFEEIEAVTIIDVLRRGDIEVLVAHIADSKLVKGAHGLNIEADHNIESIDSDDIDMIALPGGWDGTLALIDSEKVTKILQEMDRKNRSISAICAAPLVLHKAGVLNTNYTCYPSIEKEIGDKMFSDDNMVVEDKNIITSRGPATAICFALAIVKKLAGDEKYETVKSALLADFCK